MSQTSNITKRVCECTFVFLCSVSILGCTSFGGKNVALKKDRELFRKSCHLVLKGDLDTSFRNFSYLAKNSTEPELSVVSKSFVALFGELKKKDEMLELLSNENKLLKDDVRRLSDRIARLENKLTSIKGERDKLISDKKELERDVMNLKKILSKIKNIDMEMERRQKEMR